MCASYMKRVKIVINDNIIEQVTDFKYLGYRIAEYRSDLEDKLQTCNKIHGAIQRHFGKQMNKETRIHKITAKAALKFGSEAWVLKKREERISKLKCIPLLPSTFRSSTDEIFETFTRINKIG